MTQASFISNRDYPNGPSAYEVDMYWIPIDKIGVFTWMIGNWLMDVLLVCFSISKVQFGPGSGPSGSEPEPEPPTLASDRT